MNLSDYLRAVAVDPQQAHAPLAPSSASMWLHCAGWLAATRDLPNSAGEAAARGTAGHGAVEMAALMGGDADPAEFLPPPWCDDTTLVEDVRKAARALRQVAADYPQDQEHELRLQIGAALGQGGRFEKMLYGTADFVGYDAGTRTALVLDLKFGRYMVQPSSSQLALYAVGLRARYPKAVAFECVVIGPAFGEGDDIVFRHTWPAAYIDDLRDRVVPAAITAATAEDAPRTAGSHCRWCRAAGTCQENLNEVMGVIGDPPESADGITDAQLARVISIRQRAEAFMKEASAEATRRMRAGRPIQGLKLVASPSSRRWADPATARTELVAAGHDIDAVAPRELISPAAAERLSAAAAAVVKQRSVRAPGSAVAAPASDRRKAFTPSARAEGELDASAPDSFDLL